MHQMHVSALADWRGQPCLGIEWLSLEEILKTTHSRQPDDTIFFAQTCVLAVSYHGGGPLLH